MIVVSLSPSFDTKETWAIEKNGHMKVQAYKKRVGHMKVHEKKERKKDSNILKKNLQMERDHTKGVSIHHITSTISIHVHILI